MNGNLRVKDRRTFEEGRLFQSLTTGRLKVFMDNGEVREYKPCDLIATFDEQQVPGKQQASFIVETIKAEVIVRKPGQGTILF